MYFFLNFCTVKVIGKRPELQHLPHYNGAAQQYRLKAKVLKGVLDKNKTTSKQKKSVHQKCFY
jgi:uncharacterized protein YlxW (UPF0749 family)